MEFTREQIGKLERLTKGTADEECSQCGDRSECFVGREYINHKERKSCVELARDLLSSLPAESTKKEPLQKGDRIVIYGCDVTKGAYRKTGTVLQIAGDIVHADMDIDGSRWYEHIKNCRRIRLAKKARREFFVKFDPSIPHKNQCVCTPVFPHENETVPKCNHGKGKCIRVREIPGAAK